MILTAGFWRVLPSQYSADNGTDYRTFYKPVAENISHGRGFVLDGRLATKFPPGYPVVLALIFKVSHWLNVTEDSGAAALNLIGMGLVTMLLFQLGRLMFGTLTGLVGAALWMTYPFALWLTKQPNSEIPFMVLLYSGLLFFCHLFTGDRQPWPGYIACGVLLGLAMLTRPTAIGIGAVFLLLLVCSARKLKLQLRALAIAGLVLGIVLAVAPWEIGVFAKTGEWIPLSTSGPTNLREGLTFAVNGNPQRTQGNLPKHVEAAMTDIFEHEYEMPSVQGVATVLWRELQTHPRGVVELYLLKMGRSWYGTDSRQHESAALLIQLGYLCLFGWSIKRLWAARGGHKTFIFAVVLMMLYFWSMDVLVNSTLRYMMPVTGVLLLLVGGGLTVTKTSREARLLSEEDSPYSASIA